MPANLENSAVATGLEKVNFYSNPKERQCQRMFKLPYNCIHASKVVLKILQAKLQQYMNWELLDVQSRFRKRQWNKRSNCQHLLDDQKSKGVLEKHLLLLLLLLSRFSRVRLCVTPQMAAHQAPPSLGFSRQEYWSGLPFPSPMHESENWKGSCSVVSDS